MAAQTGFRQRKGSYGIDAPSLLPFAVLLVAGNVALGLVTRNVGPFIGAAAILAFLGFGLHTSWRGKFIVWSELLDELDLRGDEQILDLSTSWFRTLRFTISTAEVPGCPRIW